MSKYSKMYIAVRDDAPDYMVPTLVAHTVLGAHDAFNVYEAYNFWFETSFRKVVIRVNNREFDKIADTLLCYSGWENTICNGEPSCLVVLPVQNDAVPNVLKYAKMWKPKEV